jgi:hypothetical protein
MVLHIFIRQYNLYLQVLFLAVVFVGYGLKKQKKFRLHGITMLAAVVLHLISVIVVMIPSYINVLPLIAEGALGAVYITVLIHGIIGILTTVLAVWIVASWRLRQSLKYCAPKKNAMRATLILWVLAVILAVLLYVV